LALSKKSIFVIANAVKQSMRIHWIALLRASQHLATTGAADRLYESSYSLFALLKAE
jgi:hypothetical protein